MKRRTAGRLAWGLAAMAALAVATAVGLVVTTQGWGEAWDDPVFAVVFLTIGAVGALVVSRHPRNAVGWLFVAIALSAGLAFLAGEYSTYVYEGPREPIPGAAPGEGTTVAGHIPVRPSR